MAGEQLRVTDGNDSGRRLSIDADLLIGRAAPAADGRLGDDSEISRRHARVSRGPDGRLTVEDLGSANGTYVNGERIDSPRTLAPGDVVRLGKTVLQVTEGAAAPEQARVQTRASAGPAFELMITAGGALGRRVTVGSELVLGRAVSGDGRLSEDPELSRRHARLARDAAGQLTI